MITCNNEDGSKGVWKEGVLKEEIGRESLHAPGADSA